MADASAGSGVPGGLEAPAPLLPGLGAALLNMPLQEQLKLMQQVAGGAGSLLGSMPPHVPILPAPDVSATPPPGGVDFGSGPGSGKKQRGSVARASARDPTKGTTTSSNKQLSSKFRGVCWNRKNKRWQAAINSGGKYLYLGSFIDEDEAAMAFDRAAIKLRGRKGKLNFTYEGYVDADGNLKQDITLPDGAKPADPSGGGGGAGSSGPKSGGGGSKRRGARGSGEDDTGGQGQGIPSIASAPMMAGVGPGTAPGIAGLDPGAAGSLFSSPLANLSMAEVRRLLQGATGAAGAGPAQQPLGGAAVPMSSARGITTGFLGALPSTLAGSHQSYQGPHTSAFAAAANGLGPDLPLQLPAMPLSGSHADGDHGMPPPAMQQQQQQQQPAPQHGLSAGLLAMLGNAGAGSNGAAGETTNWQELLRQQTRPLIEQGLGEGRAIQQLVDPSPPPGTGGAGVESFIKGVVYTEAAGGGGGGSKGQGGTTYGAALWDGTKLVDYGTKGSMQDALEMATSLAAGEEDLQGDMALRDLLGGPSSLVPRAASLALFQALGSLKDCESLPPAALLQAGPPAAGAGAPKRTRGADGSFLGGRDKGAKRARQQQQAEEMAEAAVLLAAVEEQAGGRAQGQQQQQQQMAAAGVGQSGVGGAVVDQQQQGNAGSMAAPHDIFKSTSMLAKTGLADMLKSLANMQRQ